MRFYLPRAESLASKSNLVGAGPACGCGCKGPSSTQDNGSANAAGGKHSLCPIEEQEVFINLPEVTIYG